ncbi:MAG: hypothetical protein GX781_09755, partial [Clostridiales bacterium]|nr:hypothetical protein [Clostridiales bacterium]
MTYDDLIAAITANAPNLQGKLYFEKARYDAANERAYLFFLADVLVDEKIFKVIKKEIVKALPRMRISLRVASPSLAESFIKEPEKYAHVLLSVIGRAHPAAVSWIPEIHFMSEGDALVLELPDDFSLDYFRKQELSKLISRVIQDVFRIEPPVMLRLRDDVEKRLHRIAQDRIEDEALRSVQNGLNEKNSNTQSDKLTKKKKPTRIKGFAIAESPRSIGGLNDLSGK